MFKGKGIFSALIISAGMFLSHANSAQALIYADTATSQDVTFFGSGILTGAADGGGAWLSNTSDPPTLLGSITFGFATALFDGAGDDFELIDVTQNADEMYDVALSSDGINFTSIGIFTTLINGIDVNGAFAGAFSFIKVTNTSKVNSADLDAARGFNVVPIPPALSLFGTGLAIMGFVGWRRKRKTVGAAV